MKLAWIRSVALIGGLAVHGAVFTSSEVLPESMSFSQDGRLRPVPVRIGIRDRSNAELVSGDLEEGQQVIIGGTGMSSAPSAQQGRSPFGGPPPGGGPRR